MIAIWAYALTCRNGPIWETDKDVQKTRWPQLGCSNWWESRFWAAVTDTRFGMTLLATAGHEVSNRRREYGETLQKHVAITCQLWICKKCK